MSEANATYKQFGGIDDTTPDTLVVDTLISNEINAASNPTGLPDDVLIWVNEQGISAEVHTLASYNISETRVNPTLGDIAGNGANITGITIDSSTTNLWNNGTNRNLRLVEVSGGIIQGDVLNNKRSDYSHAFVHGTMNTASGDFVHVHGSGNKAQVLGEVFTHIEGNNNVCDASYAHILGSNNNIIDVSGGIIRVYGDSINHAKGYSSLLEGKELSVTNKSRYSYAYGERGTIESEGGVVGGIDCSVMDGAKYSVSIGKDNTVRSIGSKAIGIDHDISGGADYSIASGRGSLLVSNDKCLVSVGKYPKSVRSELNVNSGEQLYFAVGNGMSAHNESTRSDVFYVSNHRVGMKSIYTTTDMSINCLNLSKETNETIRNTYFKDGAIIISDNWDISKPAVKCTGTISADYFYGDGKYLTNSLNQGWKINATTSSTGSNRFDYYVSSHDVSFVEVINTAFRCDIDLTQLVDLCGNALGGIRWQDVGGISHRNSEYVLMNADGNTIDFDLTAAEYYGSGTIVRMNVVPHRNILNNNLNVKSGVVGGAGENTNYPAGIDISSSETDGEVFDFIYTSSGEGISYKKGISKWFDNVFVVDKSSFGTVSNVNQFKTNSTKRLKSVQDFTSDNTPEVYTTNGGLQLYYSPLLNTPDFTVTFWVKFDSILSTNGEWDYLVNNKGDGTGGGGGGWHITHFYIGGTARLYFNVGGNNVFIRIDGGASGVNFNTTDWYHLVFLNDSNGSAKIIVDNVLKLETSGSATGYENRSRGYNIAGWGNQTHQGHMYDYRHYNRVLSSDEINKIYTKATIFGDEVLRISHSGATVSRYTGTLRKDNPGGNFPYGLSLEAINNTDNMKSIYINNQLSGYVPGTMRWSGGSGILLSNYNYYPAIDPLLKNLYVGSDNGELHAYNYNDYADSNDEKLAFGRWVHDMYPDDTTFKSGVSVRGIAIGTANRIYATATNPTQKWGALYAIDTDADGNVSEAWRYTINSTEFKYEIETMPTVDTANNMIYFGDDAGIVHAINDIGSSYSLNWTLDLSAQIATTGSIDSKGILYVVQSVPAPSSLFAISTTGNNAGSILWKFQTKEGEAGLSYSSPAIDINDNVYIFTGSDNYADPSYCNMFKISNSSTNSAVLESHIRLGPFVMDKHTSSYINSSSNVFSYPKDFITSPIIDNDGSVIFTHGYQIVKLNSENTAIDWSYNLLDVSNSFNLGLSDINVSYIPTSPVVSLDGNIYVSTANKVLALDVETGVVDISYQMAAGGVTRCSPVLLNSRGQWGMHGFDSTRRGKRYPII